MDLPSEQILGGNAEEFNQIGWPSLRDWKLSMRVFWEGLSLRISVESMCPSSRIWKDITQLDAILPNPGIQIDFPRARSFKAEVSVNALRQSTTIAKRKLKVQLRIRSECDGCKHLPWAVGIV